VLAWLAAVQGRDAECVELADAALTHAIGLRLGPHAAIATWALAHLDLVSGRPEQAYAHQGNLILPLRFARLMPGWQVAHGDSGEAGAPTPAPPAPRRTAATWRSSSARPGRVGGRRAPASR